MPIRRLAIIALPVAASVAALATSTGAYAAAAAPSAVKKGHCGGSSTYSLQVQRETRTTISVDWGVDMLAHTKGVKWTVHEVDNTNQFVSKFVSTSADGSFSTTRAIASQPTNLLTASATNPATGETCTASAAV